MISNFGDWLFESKSDNTIVVQILAEMRKRGMQPVEKQTDRQFRNGTIVLQFTGIESKALVQKALREYNVVGNIPQNELEQVNTGTFYTIQGKGTIKHKTSAGYSFEFTPDAEGIIKAVDWVEENAMHYFVDSLINKYDWDLRSSSATEVDIEKYKDCCTEAGMDYIEKFRKKFPNTYRKISVDIFFFVVLAIIHQKKKITHLRKYDDSKLIKREFTIQSEIDEKFRMTYTPKVNVSKKNKTYTLSGDVKMINQWFEMELTPVEKEIYQFCKTGKYKDATEVYEKFYAGINLQRLGF